MAEKYSGKTEDRPVWQKLLKKCRQGLVTKLVFDEVSRFSRNAKEATERYKELYSLGIELEFLKEPHINSSVYRQAINNKINIDTSMMDSETADLINAVTDGLNDYLLAIAEKQIYLAFEHAQKERELLSRRTSEGIKQAKLAGKQIGRRKGQRVITKKQIKATKYILDNYEKFNGYLSATEVIKITGISKSTFYRYIKLIV